MNETRNDNRGVSGDAPAPQDNPFRLPEPPAGAGGMFDSSSVDEFNGFGPPAGDASTGMFDSPAQESSPFTAPPPDPSQDNRHDFLGDDSDPSPRPIKTKKSRKGLIIFLCVLVLLAATVLAAPFALVSIGDSRMDEGNYDSAETLYSLCFGFNDSDRRLAVAQALGEISRGNGDAGIAAMLRTGVTAEINYDLNGGEFVNANRQTREMLSKDSGFSTLYNARKTYYTFQGWELVGYNFTPDFDDCQIAFSFKAHYEPTQYKITYSNLFTSAVNNPQEYTYNTGTFSLNSPQRTGYTFTGWTGTDLSQQAAVTIPQGSHGDRSYFANWQANQYSLTLTPGEGYRVASPMTVTYDAEYSLPTIEKRGYALQGWTDGTTTHRLTGVWQVASDLSLTPNWGDPILYTITYDLAGGELDTGSFPKTYTVESADITINQPPKRHGFAFQGWSLNGASAKSNVSIKTNSVGNATIKAVWQGNPHKLYLDANGGSGVPSFVNVRYDENYSIPTPTRTGYTFQGWYNSAGSKVTGGKWNTDSDLHVTASWTPGNYRVTLDANGGSASYSSTTITYNASYSLPTPTRTGYTFQGWYNGNTKVASSGSWKIASDVKLTAKWTGNTYTIYLSANGGSVSSSRLSVVYDNKYTLPTPTRKGYVFDGWYESGSKVSNSGTWTRTDNMSLTARWSIKTFIATLEFDDGKTKTQFEDFNYNDYYRLPTPSRTGFEFLGWYKGSTKVASSGTWTWEENVTFTAKWKAIKSTLYFDPNGGRCTVKKMSLAVGESYYLPPATRTGYIFKGWYNGNSMVPLFGIWLEYGDVDLVARWQAAD